MPSINLRLTEEEHRQLEAWAKDGHRSLQKEIIFRLFTGTPAALGRSATSASSRSEMRQAVVADAQPRDVPSRAVLVPDPHFKPDPKK